MPAAAPAPHKATLAGLAAKLCDASADDVAQTPKLSALRRAAEGALKGGFDWPTHRHEAWRHTALGALPTTPWRAPALAPMDQTALQAQLDALPSASARLVFVDGALHHNDVPKAAGLRVVSLRQAQRDHDPALAHLGSLALHDTDAFAALNTAQLGEGALVVVKAGTVHPTPVQLVFVTTQAAAGAVVQPRVLVHVEAGAEASISELHLAAATTPSGSWTNALTELVLADNARLDYAVLQHQSIACYHLGAVGARLARDARLGLYTFDDGSKLGRRALHVQLMAPGGECALGHVALAGEGQHQATQATVQHIGAHTRSHQIFKAAVAARGSAAFGGLVDIAPNAPQVAAQQLSRALLLDKNAQASLQPQLQILTDDVKCAHGATVGELDQEALFYLMSRGIDAAQARKLLTFAFLGDALQAAPAALRPSFVQRAAHWLGMDADVGRAPRELTQGEA